MINVVSGDIARIEADAIITAINSGGAWLTVNIVVYNDPDTVQAFNEALAFGNN